MKQNNTPPDSSLQQELYLKELNPFKDKRYGNVTLFINPSTEMYYTRKEKIFKSKTQLSEVVNKINKRINSPNLYFVSPLTYEYDEIFLKEANRKVPILKLFAPFPEENLETELIERIKEKRPFNNKEITYLMYDLMLGFYHLQCLNFSHCKFGPEFVAKTTTGYAILDDPLHYPYDPIDLKKRKEWYLSPEAYKAALMGHKAGKSYNLVKSDVFSLGLVLLEAAIQMNVDEIYGHPSEGELDLDALHHLVEILKARYAENNLLVSTLKKMLTINEEERPDFFEMFERMPPYEMIKNYFESNPMTQEERQSMRNSIHGSHAQDAKDAKIFAKSRPDDTKYMKYSSIKNSRYIENIEKDEKKCEMEIKKFKPGFEIMIKSEVVEKEVITQGRFMTENDEDISMYRRSDGEKDKSVISSFSNLKPKISVKIQKPKNQGKILRKPPTPKKKNNSEVKLKKDNLLQNKYLVGSEKENKIEMISPQLKQHQKKNSFQFQGVDINALVQQKIKEELEKFTEMREKEEEIRKEREEEERKFKEELRKEREELEKRRVEGEKEKQELRREREEIAKLKAELEEQKLLLEKKKQEMTLQVQKKRNSSLKKKSFRSRQDSHSVEKSPESRRVKTSPFRHRKESPQNTQKSRINVSPSSKENKNSPKLIPVSEENLDLPEVKKNIIFNYF